MGGGGGGGGGGIQPSQLRFQTGQQNFQLSKQSPIITTTARHPKQTQRRKTFAVPSKQRPRMFAFPQHALAYLPCQPDTLFLVLYCICSGIFFPFSPMKSLVNLVSCSSSLFGQRPRLCVYRPPYHKYIPHSTCSPSRL